MNTGREEHWSRGKLVTFAVALAFMVSAAVFVAVLAFGPTSAGASHSEYTQPAQAVTPPADRQVAVIVTKSDRSGRAEALVRSLGGAVTKDLSLINAFAAEIPAGVLPQLAAGPSVARVTPDGRVESSGKNLNAGVGKRVGQPQAPAPPNHYLETLGISRLSGLTGNGIGVAVIDSGITDHPDFGSLKQASVAKSVSFNQGAANTRDPFGHGTHVAGIIAGNGSASDGLYTGVAPGVVVFNLKIADDQGLASESDVIAALQWVYDNKARYNIRVVNLSINSSSNQSYHQSQLDAACEILWFNGVVVVTSAGNKGPAGGYNTVRAAPANDPFVITVGASDEKGDGLRSNDVLAPFSAFGLTLEGFNKPDVLAPGTSIISTLSFNSSWADDYPDRVLINGKYFRLSGTSMSAPMVAGVVALLLEDEPNLTPDQVKYRLLATATPLGGDNVTRAYVDAFAAINGTTTQSANTGIPVSNLLTTGDNPVNSSVMWNSVMWNSVMWNSVNWN
ncbi:MAG: S8 family peptidase [bacterium]